MLSICFIIITHAFLDLLFKRRVWFFQNKMLFYNFPPLRIQIETTVIENARGICTIKSLNRWIETKCFLSWSARKIKGTSSPGSLSATRAIHSPWLDLAFPNPRLAIGKSCFLSHTSIIYIYELYSWELLLIKFHHMTRKFA